MHFFVAVTHYECDIYRIDYKILSILKKLLTFY